MTTNTLTWFDTADKWLTESQSLNNAQLVASHFAGSDWTPEAIAALCGNMAHESSINPNIWEYGYNHSLDRGYGLVQWTPASKYIDWANARGLAYTAGDSQLARIDYEVENNIQWIARSEFNYMTFSQFRANTGGWSSDYLTEAFTWSYERPARTAGENSMAARQEFARKCLATLDFGGAGNTPPPSVKSSIPVTTNEHAEAYKVKAGDTLSAIAKKYNVTVNALAIRNGIKDVNRIKAGQVLTIPTKNIPIVYYIVKSGDTLSKIAASHKTTVGALAAKNNIKNVNLIKVGQRIQL